jgi:uncharacterized damage-inducible protein DinB
MPNTHRTPHALMARNNAWANEVLLAACTRLGPEEWDAPRSGFFPSIARTLRHIHAVDRYYIDAATGGGLGRRAFAEAPHFASPEALAPEQAALDRRLVAFCDSLKADDLGRAVTTERGEDGTMTERLEMLLLHLFQHQIHHRGQVHAMLSDTRVPPPQLDEFYLDFDRHPTAAAWL